MSELRLDFSFLGLNILYFTLFCMLYITNQQNISSKMISKLVVILEENTFISP